MDGQGVVNRQKGDSSGGDAHLLSPVSWNPTEFSERGVGSPRQAALIHDLGRGRDRPRPRAFIKRDNLRQEILYLNFPSVDRSSGQKNRLPSLGFGTGGQKGYDQTLKLE